MPSKAVWIVLAIAQLLVDGDRQSFAQNAPSGKWHAAGIIEGYDTHIYSLAFGPGPILVTGDAKGVRVWDIDTKQEYPFTKRPLENASGITGITYAPDNSWVSFRGLHECHIAYSDKHMKDGRPISYGPGFGAPTLWPLAIASDGKTYAERVGLASQTNTVHIHQKDYSVQPVRNAHLGFCRGHEDEPLCASFSPDGKLLATGSQDKTVRLWDSTSGKQLAVLTGHTDVVSVVSFSPNGELLVTGGKDGRIKVWDVATRSEKESLDEKFAVRCLAFSPDGTLLASGDEDGVLRIWNVADAQPISIPRDHTGSIFAVTFSRDGKRLASGGVDKVIRIWTKAE